MPRRATYSALSWLSLLPLLLLMGSPPRACAQPAEPKIPTYDGPPLTRSSAPLTVVCEDGRTAEVEAGWFVVPERHGRAGGRDISLPYYRLRSTSESPATPIFLLAGGPGSSWIDHIENDGNFDEVERYRQIADVVVFDQRGGGHSLPSMSCAGRSQLPLDQPMEYDAVGAAMRELAVACRDAWLADGIDLAAYNTVESAADVDALRESLGYERMTLIGGSYGSHLALALMKLYPTAIDRVVMYGVEGLDHTWDSPDGRLDTLRRIAAFTEADPAYRDRVPEGGLLGALESVIEGLEREPQLVKVRRGDVETEVMVDANTVRLMASVQAGRRSRPDFWPEFVLGMASGDFSMAARGAMAMRNLRLQEPMHYMMDCSSSISGERRMLFERSEAQRILGDINLEYEAVCDVWGAEALGDEFRAPVVSDIPTLVLHGTWDMSTPIENAREIVAALSRAQLVEVERGGHGALYTLFEYWEPMHERLAAFLAGQDVDFPARVSIPPVEFQAAELGADGS